MAESVPVGAPSVIPVSGPGSSGLARALLVAAAQLDDLGRADADRSTGWQGAAATAYHAAAARSGFFGREAGTVLLRAALAWSAYQRSCVGIAALPGGAAREALLAEAGSRLIDALAAARPPGRAGSVGTGLSGPTTSGIGRAAWARLPEDASPDRVARWWAGLRAAEQAAVLVALPGPLGALAGLPAVVRDQANRLALARDLSALGWRERESALTAAQRRILRLDRRIDSALAGDSDALLYDYDPDAFDTDGAVSVFTADPATADHVAVLVPGFTSDASDLPDLLERAEWLEAAAGSHGESTAVLAWLGYDAPDNLLGDADATRVLTASAAEQGGGLLAELTDDLYAGDHPRHLTVIGHSYGSTTAALAAAHEGLRADDLVLLGSPGAGPGVHNVDGLGMSGGHVWVGANSRDPVASLGDHGWVGGSDVGVGLGHDPAEEDFGATRFHAESAPGADSGPLAAHGSYFEPGGESLANLGAIVSGHPEQVGLAPGKTDPWWSGPRDPEAHRRP